MCVFSSCPSELILKAGLKLPLKDDVLDDDAVILGYREWTVSPSGLLRSPTFYSVWPPEKPLLAPRINPIGNSGIYAYKNDVVVHYGNIGGQVALWGQVYFHNGIRAGYRAEFGYPVMLDVPSERIAELVNKNYGPYGVWVNLKGKPYN